MAAGLIFMKPSGKDEQKEKAQDEHVEYKTITISGMIEISIPKDYAYLIFNIAGTSFRNGLDKCVGTFDGKLVPEPDNEHDPNAIKIMWNGTKLIGYVPWDRTLEVKSFIALPCECSGALIKDKDEDGTVFYWGKVVISRKR